MLKEPIIKKDNPTKNGEGERKSKWFAIGYDDHKLYYVGTWDCSDEAYKSMKRLYPDVPCMYVANEEVVKFWMFQIGIVLDGDGLYSVPKKQIADQGEFHKEDCSIINQNEMMRWFTFTSDGNFYYSGVHDNIDDTWDTADEVYDNDDYSWQNRGVYSEVELQQWKSLVNTILGSKNYGS